MVMSIRNTVGTVLLTLLAVSSSLLLSSCSQKSNEQASRGGGSGSMLPVEAQIIHPQLLRNTIFTTGTLLANEEVELRSETSGRITRIFFQEGKRVKKGELLLKINDSELQAQLKGKEVEEKLASDQESRMRKLRETNLVSQEDYDKELNTLHVIQADKEAIEALLAQTEIVAPFSGIVGLRYVSEGGYVTPDVLIATMQDIDPLKVEFSVPEKYALQIKLGTEIAVQVGDSQEKHLGVVYAVESKVDLETRTIRARARIPNPSAALIPGSFGKVEITLNELPDAIMIPSGSVIPRINDEIVYICRSGKAQSIVVTTGIRTDSNIQIVRGLTPGDTLIVTGLLQLTDGKDVQIKAFKGN